MRKGLSIIVGIAILLFAYSASAGVVTSNLVSWWKFDDGEGTTADDSGPGSLNDGTLVGLPDWTTNTAGSASSWALDFDGTNDYVGCGNDPSLNITNAITLEAWIRRDVADVAHSLGGKWTWSWHAYRSYFWEVGANNKVNFILSSDGTDGGSVALSSISTISTNQWYHLAGVWDGSEMKIYVDGSLDNSTSYTAGIYSRVATPVAIGIQNYGDTPYYNYFNGTIDEVRIYNKALSQPEIQQNIDAIPEPSALLLLGGGLLGLLVFRRIKGK